jgi:hypothetical protein
MRRHRSPASAPPGGAWVSIEAVARRKLDQLDAASESRDLASPPGNRLEALGVQCAEDAAGRAIARIRPWRGANEHRLRA